MSIQIGFSSTTNFGLIWIGSWLIRSFLGTRYSHCYIRIGKVVYESTACGFRAINAEAWLKKSIVIREFTIPLSYEENEELQQFFVSHLGKEYSYLNLLGNGIKMLTGIEAFKDGMNKMMCSEMVYRALGYKFKLEKNPDFITPRDLYRAIEAKYGN